MHLLTLNQPAVLGKTHGPLEQGEYLMQDRNAFEIAFAAPALTIRIRDSGWQQMTTDTSDKILIMRSGSIGDLLRLTPALAAWKKKTGMRVALSCFAVHAVIFQNTDVVDELVEYPLPASRIKEFRQIISLEEIAELDHVNHITDVFAKALDVETPLVDYRPIYKVTDEEKEAAKKHLFATRPTLAIQPRASTHNRDYPGQLWREVMDGLERRGWGVVLLGKKGQVPNFPGTPYIRNLANLDLSLRESVAVLSVCQAFAGVDSSMIHFAAALEIPAVSLYGPFPWQIRTAHDPKTTNISGSGPCAPCFWHMKNPGNPVHFPPNMPCSQVGFCVVMAGIKTDRVIAKIDALKP